MTASTASSPMRRRLGAGGAVLWLALAAFAAHSAPDTASPPARGGLRGGFGDGGPGADAPPSAARGNPRGGFGDGGPGADAPPPAGRGTARGGFGDGGPGVDDRRGPRPAPAPAPGPGAGRWFDGAHGHARSYPAPGRAVRHLPPRSRIVFWSGVNYGFYDGVWYAPGPHGYAVVRPPYGVVVGDLPLFRTLVVVGGLTYLYANGVYYRERVEGGYEVVPPPVADEAAPAAAAAAQRTFVYPRANQGPEQQASDEYECHRWAVTQSGFDPTVAATGGPGATPGADPSTPPRTPMALRSDYQRARSACLEGRGYTVK